MEVFNVKYETDYVNKKITVKQIDEQDVFVHIFEPGQEMFDEILSQYHQFPGVATSVIFPQLNLCTEVYVLTIKNALQKYKIDRTVFNFHICNKRFVFGNLPAILVNQRDIEENLCIGAPIFIGDKLVSVITAFHRVNDDEFLIPVTGIREPTLVSAHLKVSNGVRVEKLLTNMSVYGTKQLPYNKIKQYALEQETKMPPANALETCMLFYKSTEIHITLNKNDYEMMHIRMPGPLVQPSNIYY